MHATGNDFVVLDGPVPQQLLSPERLRALADRRAGIGFDQALLIATPRRAGSAASYRVFNADGTEVEQCGNGARCIAMLLHRRGLARDDGLTLETRARLIRARVTSDGAVSVDLGTPDFDPRTLPFETPAESDSYALEVAGERVHIGAVSLGNPHAVLIVPAVEKAPVASLGPVIERHPRFAKGVNVGFLEIIARDRVRLRVYERGAGETQACGTGACAAVAVARRRGLLDPHVRVETTGGELRVNWPGRGERIWLTGDAHISFRGEVEIE
jgi:diaminopimelate epimerase